MSVDKGNNKITELRTILQMGKSKLISNKQTQYYMYNIVMFLP